MKKSFGAILFLLVIITNAFLISSQDTDLDTYFNNIEESSQKYNSGEISILQLILYLDSAQTQINEYFREKTRGAEDESAVMQSIFNEIEGVSIKDYQGESMGFGTKNEFIGESKISNSGEKYSYGNYNSELVLNDIKINMNIYYYSGRDYSWTDSEGNKITQHSSPSFTFGYEVKTSNPSDVETLSLKNQVISLKTETEAALSDKFITEEEQEEMRKISDSITRKLRESSLKTYNECIDFAEELNLSWDNIDESENEYKAKFDDSGEEKTHTNKEKFFKYTLGEFTSPWDREGKMSFTLNCNQNKENGVIKGEGGYINYEGRNLVKDNLGGLYYELYQKQETEKASILENEDEFKEEFSDFKANLESFYSKKTFEKSETKALRDSMNTLSRSFGEVTSNDYDSCVSLAEDLDLNEVDISQYNSENYQNSKRYELSIDAQDNSWKGFNTTINAYCTIDNKGNEYGAIYSRDLPEVYFMPNELRRHLQGENSTKFYEFVALYENKTREELVNEFSDVISETKTLLDSNSISVEEFRDLNNRFRRVIDIVTTRMDREYETCNQYMKDLGMTEYERKNPYDWLSKQNHYYKIIKQYENADGIKNQNWYVHGACGVPKDENRNEYISIGTTSYISELDDTSGDRIVDDDTSTSEAITSIKENIDDLIADLKTGFDEGTISEKETIKELSAKSDSISNAFSQKVDSPSSCEDLMAEIGAKRHLDEGINTDTRSYYLTKYFNNKEGISIQTTCREKENDEEFNPNYMNIILLWSLGEPTLNEIGEDSYNYYKTSKNPFYDYDYNKCNLENIEKNARLLNKYKEDLDNEFIDWYYNEFTEEQYKISATRPESLLGENLNFMRKITRLENNIGRNLLECSNDDLEELPQETRNKLSSRDISVNYKQGDNYAQIWEETIEVGTESNSPEMTFTLYEAFFFPEKEQFKKILVEGLIPQLEKEAQRNKEFNKKHNNSEESDVIKFIADKYGGSFDVKFDLFDNGEKIITRYGQINPEVGAGIVQNIENQPDIRLEVNYDSMYDLIVTIVKTSYESFEKNARGGFYYEKVDPEWYEKQKVVEVSEGNKSRDEYRQELEESREEREKYVTVISTSNYGSRKAGYYNSEEFQEREINYFRVVSRSVISFVFNRDSVDIKPSSATLKFYWNLGSFIEFLNERNTLQDNEEELLNDVKNQVGEKLVQRTTGINLAGEENDA